MFTRLKRVMAVLVTGLMASLPLHSTQAQTATDLDIVVALDRSESISGLEAVRQIEGVIYTLLHPQFQSCLLYTSPSPRD